MSKQINVILSLKDKFTKPLEKTKEQLKDMERVQKRAQNQMNKWAKGGVKGLNDFSDKLIKTTSLLGGLAAAFAMKTGFTEAMNLEGYKMQLETAMKDTKKAAEMMKWAVDFANKTPFETGPIVEATAKLEMYGLAAKTYLPLAGNMAASMNKDVMQAVEAIADAQTGELERLKEFGIKKQDIQSKADEMFKKNSTINKKGQIADAEQFNKAMQAIMIDKFAGGMDKQAKTLKGRWSTITGIFKSGLAKIIGMGDDGKVIPGSAFETMGKLVEDLAKKFETWQKDGTLDRIQKDFSATFKKIVGSIKRTVAFVKDNPELVKFLLGIGLAIMVAAKAVIAAKGIMTFFASMRTVAAGAAGASAIGMGPLGWIFLIIAGLILIIVYWKDIKKWAKSACEWISDKVKGLPDAIATGFKNVQDSIVKWGVKTATDLIETLKTNFGGLFDWWLEKVNIVKDAILGIVKATDGAFTDGKTFDVTGIGKKTIGNNAKGTSSWRGGLTKVHEDGGEIMDLPRGTRIYPHDKSVKMARNEGKQFTFQIFIENLIGDNEMVDRVGGLITRKIITELGNM